MEFLDIRTVVFSQLLIHLVCTLVLFLLWRNNRGRYDGLSFWVLNSALQPVALALVLLRGHIPDFLSMVGGNTLAFGSVTILYSGLSRFAGRPALNRLNLYVLAVFALIHSYFSVVDVSFYARNLNFNFFLVVYSLRIVALLRAYPPELKKHAAAVSHPFMAFAAISLARIALLLSGQHAHDFMQNCQADTALFLLYSGLIILLTYGLFIMVNRRLLADTRADFDGRIEAERALSGALKVARLGTWRWDIKSGQLAWSEEMYSIFGLDKASFTGDLGAVIARAIHPEDRAAVDASNRRVAQEGLPAPIDYRVLWPDGSVHWVHAEASELVRGGNGEIQALKGYAQDITARKRSEETLRKSEEKFALVFRTAPYAVTISALDDGRILDVNEAFCSIIGYSRSEAVGRTSLELNLWERPEARARVVASLASGPLRHLETVFRRKNGNLFEAEFSSEILELDGRAVIISSIKDISGAKQAETAMQTAQRLESLGALAGGIAHDFNNLLTGITGNLSLMRSAAGARESIDELAGEAESACLAARSLARQLLTFASGGEPVKAPVDIAALLRDSVVFSLRGSNSRHSISGGEGLRVLGDREQLFQVFQNLALNAAQAMAGGGEVTVKLEALALRAGEVPPLGEGRYLLAEVRDSGSGIPPEIMHRIFDPYFSTKAQGRGLGLAVCRSVIVKHGGTITVASEPGKGSVFRVYLPLTDRSPSDSGRTPQAVIKGGSGRVLVMEDEEVVYKALVRMLTAIGYEAEVVADGAAALKAWTAAEQTGKPFIAAIMDLTIPGGMGGAEAVKLLKAAAPGAKVLVSSGYSEDPVMAGYADYGFDGVLAKPYRLEDLASALEKLSRKENQ